MYMVGWPLELLKMKIKMMRKYVYTITKRKLHQSNPLAKTYLPRQFNCLTLQMFVDFRFHSLEGGTRFGGVLKRSAAELKVWRYL